MSKRVNILLQLTEAILDELKLPSNFITNLYSEDDWSFIIKLHTLIETSLTDTLSTVVKDGKLEKQFALLNISDDRIGKIRFAINLELISDKQYNFIKKISEIRNYVIHDIKNINFSFFEYIDTLDSNQKKVLKKSIYDVLPDGVKNSNTFDESDILVDIKAYITITAFMVIANLFSKKYDYFDRDIVL